MSWIWSALMPHPPIIVPEVGKGAESRAAATLEGTEALTAALKGRRPDALFVLSPHQPYAPGALFVNSAARLRGSFALFGAPQAALDLATAGLPGGGLETLLPFLEGAARVRSAPSPDLSRDQGTMVPLYFLRRAWGELPPVVLASPIGLSPEEAFALGRALAGFRDGRRWALLASGDLSHRLTPDAPAGYAPEDGPAFDAAVEEALRARSPEPLFALSPERVERAGECGLRSVLALLGLAEAGEVRVLSHEGPFGVGYCNALWLAPTAPAALARETVTRLLEGRPLPRDGKEAAGDWPLWGERRACFVSIKNGDGSLRGCIGALSPAWPSLDREIIENAVLASTRDPRFPPMARGELDGAVFSVDVLSEPEPVEGLGQLDPRFFGVIVSKGGRRGVLLPGLEGVDTPERQAGIAAQKAGIRSLEGASFQRFRADRYRE